MRGPKGYSGLTKENEVVSEALAEAEVDAVENRDKDHGRAAADSVTYTAPAHSAWDTPAATATEKGAIRSRLGELHRLLNNRQGSLDAPYKKKAEANDRAYDMNQKTTQASDALAEEYTAFEASMKKVTFEHEEEDVLFAAATEVTGELERAQEDQDRLQDELASSCEDMATAAREFSNCWAARSSNCKNKQRFQRILQ